MAKSSEALLYGVRGFEDKSREMPASKWMQLRHMGMGKDSHGVMNTPDGVIAWFRNPIIRDEFKKAYKGTSVTLTRKVEITTGVAARKLIQGLKQ